MLVLVVIMTCKLIELQSKNNFLEKALEQRAQKVLKDKSSIEKRYEELSLINKAKDRVFAFIGHELRSPMMGLTSLTEKVSYLIKNEKFDHLDRFSKQLDNYVLDTQNLLSNLLNWAKIMQLEKEIEQENIAVHETIEKITAVFVDSINRKQIKLFNQVPVDAYVKYDLESFFIVFRNLIHNAIKFSHPNGSLIIQYEKKEEQTIITITDQGVGVSDRVLNNWTKDHFFYSSRGTAGEKGSGLGLALCRMLTTINENELYLHRAKEQGTIATFIVKVNSGSRFSDINESACPTAACLNRSSWFDDNAE